LAVYLAVRESSATHHGGLIRIGEVSLLSASPERFLDVEPEGLVRTRPIKGTRARGATPDADARLAAELLASEKERAENLMIVDLMRNDLSRVCEVGSIAVTRLLAVESYAHVHQLVSTVEGRLRSGYDAIDAIGACFPAGSMTGAPKLRATELLDELEQRPRGIYAGTFGYLGFDGRADLAMTIRSIVLDERGATVGAGGGITALSDPEEELAEARLKAAALLAALGVQSSVVQAPVESRA
jgi:anthranilate synthase component 1